MKKSFFVLFFLIIALFTSCKENEVRLQYENLQGSWLMESIQNTVSPFNANKNISLFFETCKYTNKNLNAGKHACIGEIRFNDKKQNFNYRIVEGNVFSIELVNETV